MHAGIGGLVRHQLEAGVDDAEKQPVAMFTGNEHRVFSGETNSGTRGPTPFEDRAGIHIVPIIQIAHAVEFFEHLSSCLERGRHRVGLELEREGTAQDAGRALAGDLVADDAADHGA